MLYSVGTYGVLKCKSRAVSRDERWPSLPIFRLEPAFCRARTNKVDHKPHYRRCFNHCMPQETSSEPFLPPKTGTLVPGPIPLLLVQPVSLLSTTPGSPSWGLVRLIDVGHPPLSACRGSFPDFYQSLRLALAITCTHHLYLITCLHDISIV